MAAAGPDEGLISLHSDDDSRLDWQRALDAIHAGAVVVTEHSSGIAPLVPGEHLLVASADVASLRRRGPAARRAAPGSTPLQAYERLSTWIPYALPVSVLRAAIVELVGEPVPSERRSTRLPRRRFRRLGSGQRGRTWARGRPGSRASAGAGGSGGRRGRAREPRLGGAPGAEA